MKSRFSKKQSSKCGQRQSDKRTIIRMLDMLKYYFIHFCSITQNTQRQISRNVLVSIKHFKIY